MLAHHLITEQTMPWLAYVTGILLVGLVAGYAMWPQIRSVVVRTHSDRDDRSSPS